MTRIDFYTHADDRLKTACLLCAKAVEQGLRVYLWITAEADFQVLDDLLWQIPPAAFMPHGRIDCEDAARLPVLIGNEEPPRDLDGLLINLTDRVPSFFSRFERLIEIVSLDEAVAAAARQRYRHYREQGYTIQTHALDQSRPSDRNP